MDQNFNQKPGYGIYLILVISLSVALMSVLSYIYFFQKRVLEENNLAMRNFREARIDLSKGFLQAGLASQDVEGNPFKIETGLAYINQSVVSMKNSLNILNEINNVKDTSFLKEFEREVKHFNENLNRWALSGDRQSGIEAELRTEFSEIENSTKRIDILMSKQLKLKKEKFEYIFYISVLVISIFLTLFIILIFKMIAKEIDTRKTFDQIDRNYNDLLKNMLNAVIYIEAIPGKNNDFVVVSHNTSFSKMTSCGMAKGKILSQTHELAFLLEPEMIELISSVINDKSVALRDIHFEKANLITTVMAYSPQENHVILVLENITERVRFEKELVAKNAEYYALYEEYQSISDDLKEHNDSLSNINAQLEEAKEKAEESDRLKTAFLQNMSHEIRTPLNAILGFSDLLFDYFDNKDKLLSFTSIINQRGKDLLIIIDDILDIALIESGQISIVKNQFNLKEFLADLNYSIDEIRTRMKKSNVVYIQDFNLNNLDINIITDQFRLKQVLLNLLNNAYKFTHSGHVKLSCEINKKGELLFEVSDTGIGIPAKTREAVFERFIQAENNSPAIYGGTGLGLSIVKGLMVLLDGEIKLDSSEGSGSSFQISIPLGDEFSPVNNKNQILGFEKFDFSSIKVLVVEDDSFNALYLNELLTNESIDTTVVNSGEDAIKICSIADFDVILMDIRLLQMNGIEAAARIKATKPSIKIIAQTAFASETDKFEILNSGFDGYISKPISREEVLAEIFSIHKVN